MGIKRRW